MVEKKEAPYPLIEIIVSMGTSKAQQLALFGDGQRGSAYREALSVPRVESLVDQLIAELPGQAGISKKLLSRIYDYLFVQKKLKAPELEKELPSDLYITLYGLKSMLQKHSPRVVALNLAEHKARFQAFLDAELED